MEPNIFNSYSSKSLEAGALEVAGLLFGHGKFVGHNAASSSLMWIHKHVSEDQLNKLWTDHKDAAGVATYLSEHRELFPMLQWAKKSIEEHLEKKRAGKLALLKAEAEIAAANKAAAAAQKEAQVANGKLAKETQRSANQRGKGFWTPRGVAKAGHLLIEEMLLRIGVVLKAYTVKNFWNMYVITDKAVRLAISRQEPSEAILALAETAARAAVPRLYPALYRKHAQMPTAENKIEASRPGTVRIVPSRDVAVPEASRLEAVTAPKAKSNGGTHAEHQVSSMTPDDLEEWARKMRTTEQLLGKTVVMELPGKFKIVVGP